MKKHQLIAGSIGTPAFDNPEDLYEWIGNQSFDYRRLKKFYYYGIYETNGIEYNITKERQEYYRNLKYQKYDFKFTFEV